jgi:hypothetical protein
MNVLQQLAATLSLPDSTTAEQLTAHFNSLKARAETAEAALKTQIEAAAKAKAETLIDQAIKDKKLTPADRDKMVANAIASFDLVKDMLDKIPAVKAISSQLQVGGTVAADPSDKSTWKADDYIDSEGGWPSFCALKDSNPSLYNKLFKDKYGVEPKA